MLQKFGFSEYHRVYLKTPENWTISFYLISTLFENISQNQKHNFLDTVSEFKFRVPISKNKIFFGYSFLISLTQMILKLYFLEF